MTRYFLNVHDGSEIIDDIEGQEFRDLAQARKEATRGARDLAANLVREGKALGAQGVELCDSDGAVLQRYDLKDMVRFRPQ